MTQVATVNINRIINVNNTVITPQSTSLQLILLALTDSLLLPVDTGWTVTFPNLASVSNYFGLQSDEYLYASVYFRGYTGATATPPAIAFSRYLDRAFAGFLASPTLTDPYAIKYLVQKIKALTPTPPTPVVNLLNLSINGTPIVLTTANLNFSAATVTSLSAIATLLQTKISAVISGTTVSVIAGTNNLVITAPATTPANPGATTISYATGKVADTLGLSNGFGATLSQGANAQTPAQNLGNIVNNFNAFFTIATIKRLFPTSPNGDNPNTTPGQESTGYLISVGIAKWIQ